MRVVGLVIAVTLFSVHFAFTAEPVDVGDRAQLFVDGLFLESSENVALRVVPPTKTDEQTLVPDKPWEDASLNWFSVIEDNGKYRMWYECYDVPGWPTMDDTSFCYAESTDGIHWTKPALGLFPYGGSNETNILFRKIGDKGFNSRVHGTSVFVDPNAPAEARYKAVSQGQFETHEPPYRVAGMYSADGLRWTRYAKPICDIFADSQYSGFWDAAIGQYVLYGRVSGKGRSIGRSTSAALDQFEPLSLVLELEPSTDLYNPAALKYPYADRVYFMFPSVYDHASDMLDIHLAVSRDGVHWTWPERGVPYIPRGDAGRFDSGSLYMGQGMVKTADGLSLYYNGSPLKHNEAELENLTKPENKRIFSRVVTRENRFVAVTASDTPGHFTTPPLQFAGNVLELNCATNDGGEIRVGLRDADGNAIPGFGVEDCEPIRGDEMHKRVTWKAGVELPATTTSTIKLEIALRNARIFAFQFAK